jgi:hypothetical protein
MSYGFLDRAVECNILAQFRDSESEPEFESESEDNFTVAFRYIASTRMPGMS